MNLGNTGYIAPDFKELNSTLLSGLVAVKYAQETSPKLYDKALKMMLARKPVWLAHCRDDTVLLNRHPDLQLDRIIVLSDRAQGAVDALVKIVRKKVQVANAIPLAHYVGER